MYSNTVVSYRLSAICSLKSVVATHVIERAPRTLKRYVEGKPGRVDRSVVDENARADGCAHSGF